MKKTSECFVPRGHKSHRHSSYWSSNQAPEADLSDFEHGMIIGSRWTGLSIIIIIWHVINPLKLLGHLEQAVS